MAELLVGVGPDHEILLITLATFLLAGCVKGIVGFGLPTVALAMLAATVGLKAAIALTVFPALFTNIWQALAGGRFIALSRRLATMLAMIVVGIALGSYVLARVDGGLLAIVLGVTVVIYATLALNNLTFPPIGRAEVWANPMLGAFNGVITGLTGTFIVPGVLYLQALEMPRRELVQAMGIVFCLSTIALAVFLTREKLMPGDLAVTSLLATAPAFAGMWVGQRIGARLSDAAFKRAFLWALLVLGVFLAARNAAALFGWP